MLRHLAAFAFYLALAVAVTWPLAVQLGDAAPDLGDPLLISWILDWGAHSLTHDPLNLFHAPIYHPARFAFAFSEHMTGIALIVLPFHLAGASALTLYGVALILGMAWAGYGAFVLARVVTSNTLASLIAGVIFGYSSFTIGHVQHLQIVWSGWLPLLLAALLVYWRSGARRDAALLGGAFLMNGLTSVHWLLFGGFTLLVTIGFLQFAQPQKARRFWLILGVALGGASLLLLPFLIPYQIMSETYQVQRTSFEARLGSAVPIHWLVPSTRNLLWGRLGDSWRMAERELFPGALAIVLTIIGLAARPLRFTPSVLRRRITLDAAIILFSALTLLVALQDRVTIGEFSFAGADVPGMIAIILLVVRIAPAVRVIHAGQAAAFLWLIVGFLASLGWNFVLHPFLFRILTPFRATRAPARWAVIAYVGIAVLAAVGAVWVMARLRRAGIVMLLVSLIEVASRIHWVHVDSRTSPVYAWLARERPRAVIELPMLAEGIPFLYLLAQTEHRVPLINGTSGWETPLHERLRVLEDNLAYGEAFLAAVRESEGEWIIVHESRLTDEEKTAIRPMLAKLPLVARFGSDAVYSTRAR